ncbi:hypothetical protein ACIRO3_34575 [Streptomyces sp. NPDC102278]|uniref:hypothetical protein n=1 Tax=Streptomyces sp. NPDC102278 TaxID=3366152 RepID=UPI00382025B5
MKLSAKFAGAAGAVALLTGVALAAQPVAAADDPYTIETSSTAKYDGIYTVVEVDCPAGSKVTGGGYELGSGTEVLSNRPTSGRGAWTVGVSGKNPVTAYAICTRV